MLVKNRLAAGLRLIAGCTVDRIGLLVWPDEGALEEADVCLYLELICSGEDRIDVAIGTSSDGQTPVLNFDHVDAGKPLSELGNRRREWASDGFWESQNSYSSELFFAAADTDCKLSVFCAQKILRVFVVCFADNDELPTGIVLEFENGSRLWSVPSNYGNAVKTEVPDDWWPAPVRLRETS